MYSKLVSVFRKSKGKWYFFLVGLLALMWFLVRVIPKPSRATYPCQRAAFPIASAFVIYIAGLFVAAGIFRKTIKYLRRSRYFLAAAGMVGMLAVVVTNLTLNPANLFSKPLDEAVFIPNQPMGTISGAMSGRVVWAWNPDVVDEDCPNTWKEDRNWYMPEYTSVNGVYELLDEGVQELTGESGTSSAWEALFKYHNESKGISSLGYSAGEKIAIKTNFVTCDASNMVGHDKEYNLNMIDVSPQLMWSVLDQLINQVGVKQSDISIGDPSAYFPDQYYNMLAPDFPDVVYLSLEDAPGRTGVLASTEEVIQFSDGNGGDYLPSHFVEANYLINMSVVKHHGAAGFSDIAKNHYGSNMRNTAEHMHASLVEYQPGLNHYRHFVDLLAHEDLGGKTILNIGDMLWASSNAWSGPKKFQQTPFNDDYPSSLLLGVDPIAVESVSLDFIRTESWDDAMATTSGVDDFLRQAADPNIRPEGIVYDPEGDGSVVDYSLGIYEHWNNSTDKAYSKNLGTDEGIELLRVFLDGEPGSDVWEVISFSDIKPAGFPLQFCWNSMGVDPSDNIYIAFGENLEWEGHDEDMALFTYHHETGEKRFLDTYNNVLDKAGNRESGEVVSKGHTDIVYMDGRMYVGTQPNNSPSDDLDSYRGSHLLAYDIALDSMMDLSQDLPGGVIQEHRGLLSIAAIPSMNYILGYGNPYGDLVYFNTETNTVDRVVSGDRLNTNITRNIFAAEDGRVIYSWGWERMYVYNFENDQTTRTDFAGGRPFWNGSARTADGSLAYICDPEGSIYKLNMADESLETLGKINPSGGGILSLVLSEDESKLYSIPGIQPYQLIAMDVLSGETEVAYEFPAEFGEGDYTFTGNNIKDSRGRIYFARHQMNSDNADGSYDGELIVIDLDHCVDLAANQAPTFELTETFLTEVKNENDTLYITNLSDGDEDKQVLEITASKGDSRDITSPLVHWENGSGNAIITFMAKAEGTVELEIQVSDDGSSSTGGPITTTKTVEIQIAGALSSQEIESARTQVFPNPACGWVNIKTSIPGFSDIGIYNLQGRMLERHMVSSQTTDLRLDISHLPDGIYILEMRGEKQTVVRELFVNSKMNL